jgi:hypothetical protein
MSITQPADHHPRQSGEFWKPKSGEIPRPVDNAELGAEMPWIGRDGGERLRGRAEQDRVDHRFVLEGDLANRRRQCEDDMEVWHRQQLGLPLREPL